MQYQLIRSKRRSLSISFDDRGNLIVKAPIWMSQYDVEKLILQKTDWILNTEKRLQKTIEDKNKRKLNLENGDILWLLGDKRILVVLHEERKTAKVKNVMDQIVLWVPYDADYDYRLEQIEKWYRKEAKRIISEKTEQFAKIMNVSYKDIHIKDQKSRWGSCSSKGNLNFNWRIIMAPEPVCDYVIVHELCHLTYMDHSCDFWKMVGIHCPDYGQYKKWLRNNSDTLYFLQPSKKE